MGRAALVFALCGACASSSSVVCDDGSTCPGGFQCDVEHDRCLLPEQVSACEGKQEGEDCTYSDMPGGCHFGACETFFCGDGRITGTEQCDGDDLGVDNGGNPATCITAGFYAPDGLACNPRTCVYDTMACGGGRCGDKEVNGPEACDGLTKQTCVSIGFDAGSVACTSSCAFQITDCSRFGWNPESISDVAGLAVAGSSPADQWVVGDKGKAMHYEGAFWNSYPTGVTNPLTAAWSIAPNDTWATGLAINQQPPVVIHWNGNQWSIVTGIPAADYLDVWATGANSVYLATKTGVLRFDGSMWTALGNLAEETIAIRGTSTSDIYVATKAGALKHWDGNAWMTVTLSNVEPHFIDANKPKVVWVLGYVANNLSNGVVAHWDGATWTQHVFANQVFANISSSAANDTWVAGNDGIMRHWDGVAWSRTTNIGASSTGLAAISGMIHLNATTVLAVSTQRLAYRYRGQAFGTYPPLGPDPFTATDNNAIWGTAANNQYIVNVRGEVWHFNGTTWTTVFTTPGNVPTKAIHGIASDDIWVGADNGRMYHWDGNAWTGEDVATTTIRKVWVSAAGDVWAFTDSHGFHKEGSTWMSYVIGGNQVTSVSGTGPNDVWVVDSSLPHKLWHWTGSDWSEVATGATTPMLAVVAVSGNDVHVSAEQGRLYHWNGTSWNEQIVTPLAELTMLAATSHTDVIAASERDLFHYDGQQWTAMRPPVDFVPNTADYLPIVSLQATPGRLDMLMRRYYVRTLLRTRALKCDMQEKPNCNDGVDNDCDGTIDSADAECGS
jgi:hypothetical protein